LLELLSTSIQAPINLNLFFNLKPKKNTPIKLLKITSEINI